MKLLKQIFDKLEVNEGIVFQGKHYELELPVYDTIIKIVDELELEVCKEYVKGHSGNRKSEYREARGNLPAGMYRIQDNVKRPNIVFSTEGGLLKTVAGIIATDAINSVYGDEDMRFTSKPEIEFYFDPYSDALLLTGEDED